MTNNIQQHWKIKKLGEVCTIKPPRKEAKEKLNENDFVSFLPMADLGIAQRKIIAKQERKLKDVSGSYTYFADNDVLLAKITPCFENGKLGIARNLKNGIGFGSSEYIIFRSNKDLFPDYLFYYLSGENFRRKGGKRMSGAVGHKRVQKEFVENFQIPLPPLPEQTRITKILDEAFEKLEIAKKNAEKNLENAKELFESYLQGVFVEGGDDWEEIELGKIVDFFNGYAFKSKKFVKESNTQIIRMGNLYQNKLNLNRRAVFYPDDISDKLKNYILTENDLIISLTGTTDKEDYGYTVQIPASNKTLLLNQRIAKIVVLDKEKTFKDFLLYLLLSRTFLDKLYKTANGTRQANLSTLTMKKITVNFPKSLSTQTKIVKKLDHLSTNTKKLEKIYQQKIENLDELKKSLLQKAFEGKL